MKTRTLLLIAITVGLHHSTSRAAVTLTQLDQVATELLQASRVPNLSGQIVADAVKSSGFAAIVWQGAYATIYVHPDATWRETLNTWAFVIGHELAHQILGHRGSGRAQQEFDADVLGAEMAIKAGYNVKDYIREMYNDANSCSVSHGCWHDRARNLEQKFGSVGGWNPKHEWHKPGDGAFPPIVTASTRQRRIPCRHIVNCEHAIACQHPIPCCHLVCTPYGWQRRHAYDFAHSCDFLHRFDYLHEYDY